MSDSIPVVEAQVELECQNRLGEGELGPLLRTRTYRESDGGPRDAY